MEDITFYNVSNRISVYRRFKNDVYIYGKVPHNAEYLFLLFSSFFFTLTIIDVLMGRPKIIIFSNELIWLSYTTLYTQYLIWNFFIKNLNEILNLYSNKFTI